MSSSQSTCGTASNLELSLLVLSIFVSFVLYSVSVKAASKIYEKGRRPLSFTFIFFIAALFAIGLVVATVVLGYKRKISLDAIAAVVFALITGLVSFPRDAFVELFVFGTVIYLRVFPVCYKNFSYVTFGRPCCDDMVAEESSFPKCLGQLCTANVYIRKLKLGNIFFPTLSRKIYRSIQNKSKKRDNSRTCKSLLRGCCVRSQRNTVIRWDSLVLQHQPSLIEVRNLDPVLEQKWYLALSSAVWLVMQPWTVHFSRPAQVICALRVISDIMSIGRLIIAFRGHVIYEIVKELDVENDQKFKAALQTCNSLIKEIGLKEWGQLDKDQIEQFENKSYKPEQLGEMYSLILLIVIFKSNLFGDWFHCQGGQEEKNALYKFGADGIYGNFGNMEDGTSIGPITRLEHFEVEDDTVSSSDESSDEQEEISKTCKNVKPREYKIRRTKWVSGALRWAGWLVNGTMPFHDPLEVAKFRHAPTSFKLIKKIQKLASDERCTCELECVMENQVDRWLACWYCNIKSSNNIETRD